MFLNKSIFFLTTEVKNDAYGNDKRLNLNFCCFFSFKPSFRTIAELSLSFLTRIVSTARRNQRLYTKSVAAFYIGKTKRLHGRKTEHFKALTQIGHASTVADHSTSTDHNIKWDHFEILASGQCDLQFKIKEPPFYAT